MSVSTLRVRNMAEIVSGMVSWLAASSAGVSDFTVGSRTRTILEAVAQETEELYLQMFNLMQESIPRLLFDGFQFPAQPARKAAGVVTFARETAAGEDYEIPAGSVVSAVPEGAEGIQRFETIAAVTLSTGDSSVEATVQAVEAGVVGNVAAGAITRIESSIDGVESVTNSAAFTTGSDAETTDSRAVRFQEWVAGLSRGTADSIRRAVLDGVDGVTGVAVVESPDLRVMLYSPSGGYSDVSVEASLPGGSAVELFPSPAVGDAVFVGAERRFDALKLHLRQAGDGVSGAWQYWNGSAWTAIPDAADNADNWSDSDTVTWAWADVADWSPCVVNGVSAYWVRYALSSASMTIAPTLSYIWATPEPGTINVIAHDVAGALSAAQSSAVASLVAAYRASGVRASVSPPTVVSLDVALSLDLAPGADEDAVVEAARAAVATCLAGLSVGERLSHENLSRIVMSADTSIRDISWSEPLADVNVSPHEIIRAGSVTVE